MLKRKHIETAAAIADQLFAKAKSRGLSDKELAYMADSTHSSIGNWRRKDNLPTLKSAIAVADALGMEIVLRDRPNGARP